jgi:hypothetical protein
MAVKTMSTSLQELVQALHRRQAGVVLNGRLTRWDDWVTLDFLGKGI